MFRGTLLLEMAASGLTAGAQGGPHVCGVCVPHLLRVQGRMYTLPDVFIGPYSGSKERSAGGELEAHSNGFRYESDFPFGWSLDIMYG